MPAPLLRRNRNFRLVFSASAVSNLGDGVSALAFPWLASLLTRDAMLISLVAMAGRLPWFLFALPAGVLTDRADRRRLMVQADLVRMILTFGIVAMVLSLPALPLAPGAGTAAILALCALAILRPDTSRPEARRSLGDRTEMLVNCAVRTTANAHAPTP